jgi:hypothetical protein
MTDRELMQMAFGALEKYWVSEGEVIKALRDRLAQPNVSYTGNGTAGRENMTAPTGYFFQMPKPEWVGLTDEEVLEEEEFINHRYGKPINHSTAILMDFVKQVEAKLKEKNT